MGPEGISRREFLVWISTIGASAAYESACSPRLPICNTALLAIQDCRRLPQVAIADPDLRDLYQIIRPVARLLPDGRQAIRIFIHPSKAVEVINGQPAESRDSIHIFVPENSVPALGMLRVTAFHEMIHVFDMSMRYQSHDIFGSVRSAILRNMRKQLDNLYTFLREGSYIEEDGFNKMGHPTDGFKELYASTLTVLRFFPMQLLENLESVDRESRKFISVNSLAFIESLAERSSRPISLTDLPFSEELLEGLKANI